MLPCRFLGVMLSAAILISPLQAATINVPGDFVTIQGAIADADTVDSDEVVVAPNTYNELIDFLGKAITLRSSGGAGVTIIDATGVADPGEGKPVVRCDKGEDPNTVLDGFTLSGGTGDTALTGDSLGGGMFNNGASPTVSNCIFSGNTAFIGGGMGNNFGSSPTVTHCTFSGNTATFHGGGMFNDLSSPTVTHCTFSGNTADEGGGMRNSSSSPKVSHCTFSGNTATSFGGGMSNYYNSSPTVTHCAFSGNTATCNGGGMFNDLSNTTVTHCIFSGNTVGDDGGGMGNESSRPTVTHCTFSGNSADAGGGMSNSSRSNPMVTNCTFIDNSADDRGGGMRNDYNSSPMATNCIFWGNSDAGGMDESAQIHTTRGTPVVNYSDVQGGWTGAGGTGNINADPNFADADGADNKVGTQDDDLRLLAGSPCIAAGDTTALPSDVLADLDGNSRGVDDPATPNSGVLFLGIPVDMGAYEFQRTKLASPAAAEAQEESARSSRYAEENNQIRRDKFDLIMPKIMRDRGIDMWIHVMREPIADPFGAEDLGSTSGVFIFTDRGGDRIERAIMGRRWQTSVYEVKRSDYVDPIPALGAYDIIGKPVLVIETLSSPKTEYDYRFNGLREFVEARKPKRIALNYREHLAAFATFAKTDDGISHVDYRLLSKELGETYADRLVSSEYLIMDYNVSPVPSETALLKKMRADDLERVDRIIEGIKPGVTKTRDVGVTVIRRMRDERSGWDDAVVQRGDILAVTSQGRFAYVLRDGETEPPADIKTLWAAYLTIDTILTETILPGLTPREIMKRYKQRLADVGIAVIDPQLPIPQTNLFESLCFLKPTLGVYQFYYGWEACWDNGANVYPGDFDPDTIQIVFDMHGVGKGAREKRFDHGLGPRMGSYGPEWARDVPLAPNHHFVLEYFFYMPSPTNEGEYLVFLNHEQVITTENGVERFSPLQQELVLIR